MGKFLKQHHRPKKFSYSCFLKVTQTFGRIENFAPPKAQGSRIPLVRAVYHDLLRRVAARSNQGRNDGGKEHDSPGAKSLWGLRKVLTRSQELQCSTFASGSPQVRTQGRQTCFLPRAPSNLVMPLAVIQYSSALSMYMEWGVAQLVQARTQGGGCRECTPPPDLKRCWHDTWFHWKSSPKIFLYCTLKINLC